MSCLNVLNDPMVFVSTAALLVIVLLVWAQLHIRGDIEKENVNFYLGLIWTYSAILVALVAVGIVLLTNVVSAWAKGFLLLSLFMTFGNILVLLLGTFGFFITLNGEQKSRSIIKPGKDCRAKIGWFCYWLASLVGLGFISFSIVGICYRVCLWIGFSVVAALAIYAAVRVISNLRRIGICCRVCLYIGFSIVAVPAVYAIVGVISKLINC